MKTLRKGFSLQEKLKKFFTSQELLSKHGATKEKLSSLEQKEEEDITSESSWESKTSRSVQINKKLFTEESQPKNSQKMLEEIFSEKNSQLTPLLQILEAELTSKEQGSNSIPYWTTQSRDISKKLWLPIKTDCVDSDSVSLKNCLKDFPMQKSWFSTKVSVPLNEELAEDILTIVTVFSARKRYKQIIDDENKIVPKQ